MFRNTQTLFHVILFIAKQYKIIFIFFYLNLMVSKFIDNTIHYFVPALSFFFICYKASSVFKMENVEMRR